jgi:hypothetical protein
LACKVFAKRWILFFSAFASHGRTRILVQDWDTTSICSTVLPSSSKPMSYIVLGVNKHGIGTS